MSKFRFTWMFVAVSVVVISTATVIVTRVVGNHAEDNLVRVAEENATRNALHIQSMLRGHHPIDPVAGERSADGHQEGMVTGHDLTQPSHGAPVMTDHYMVPATQDSAGLDLDHVASELPGAFPSLVEGLKVVKAQLYDLDGDVVWSTFGGEPGMDKEGCPQFEAVLGGQVSSRLAYDFDLVDPQGQRGRFDVVRTCIPLEQVPGGLIVGVLEVNRDVSSDVVAQIGDAKSTVFRTTIATMGGLFLFLLGFIVTADVTNVDSLVKSLCRSN